MSGSCWSASDSIFRTIAESSTMRTRVLRTVAPMIDQSPDQARAAPSVRRSAEGARRRPPAGRQSPRRGAGRRPRRGVRAGSTDGWLKRERQAARDARQPRAAHHVGELADQIVNQRSRSARARPGSRPVKASKSPRASVSGRVQRHRPGQRSLLEPDGGDEPSRHLRRGRRSNERLVGTARRRRRSCARRRFAPRRTWPTRLAGSVSFGKFVVGEFGEDISHHLRTERFFEIAADVEGGGLVAPRRRPVGRDDDADQVRQRSLPAISRSSSVPVITGMLMSVNSSVHVVLLEHLQRLARRCRPRRSRPIGTSASSMTRLIIVRIMAESSTIRMPHRLQSSLYRSRAVVKLSIRPSDDRAGARVLRARCRRSPAPSTSTPLRHSRFRAASTLRLPMLSDDAGLLRDLGAADERHDRALLVEAVRVRRLEQQRDAGVGERAPAAGCARSGLMLESGSRKCSRPRDAGAPDPQMHTAMQLPSACVTITSPGRFDTANSPMPTTSRRHGARRPASKPTRPQRLHHDALPPIDRRRDPRQAVRRCRSGSPSAR